MIKFIHFKGKEIIKVIASETFVFGRFCKNCLLTKVLNMSSISETGEQVKMSFKTGKQFLYFKNISFSF